MGNKKVALITGASAGMGKETAKLLAQKGYIVYGVARRKEKMKELETLGVHTLDMDITNDQSMVQVVEKIIATEKRIDVLINAAGFGSHGAIEDVPISDARYQLEVNLFGLARLTQLILPYMRKNNFGKIVNITSIGGKFAGPFGGWYHASKFALEGLSDSLRNEVKPFGIDVIVIEPGAIKTEWGNIAMDNLRKVSGNENSAYKKGALGFAKSVEKLESKSSDPKVIVDLICKAIEAKNPKARYAGGFMAKPTLFMRKILSDKLLDKVIKSQFS